MFDIGMPEFMIIAVVALVVLGPERLPEVMGRIGRFYRQLRQMSDEVTGEFRKQWEEGMREVEDVSSTVNDAWQQATSTDSSSQPPPRLLQAPPPLLAPQSAADAGPWVLHAWYRDLTSEAQAVPSGYPASPFALPREARPADQLEYTGYGGPQLMATAPEPEDLVAPEAVDALLADLPDLPDIPSLPDIPDLPAYSPERPETSPALSPAMASPAASTTTATSATSAATAVMDGVAVPASNGPQRGLSERERTLIELYRSGGVSLARAAEFLDVTPAQFQALLDQSGDR